MFADFFFCGHSHSCRCRMNKVYFFFFIVIIVIRKRTFTASCYLFEHWTYLPAALVPCCRCCYCFTCFVYVRLCVHVYCGKSNKPNRLQSQQYYGQYQFLAGKPHSHDDSLSVTCMWFSYYRNVQILQINVIYTEIHKLSGYASICYTNSCGIVDTQLTIKLAASWSADIYS